MFFKNTHNNSTPKQELANFKVSLADRFLTPEDADERGTARLWNDERKQALDKARGCEGGRGVVNFPQSGV